MKKRLDEILTERKLAESRTRAQALIMSGNVYAEGHQATKSGMKYEEDAQICVKDPFPYVSRGALKLEKAYEEFGIDFEGKTVCDIGSSTGGFSDFALQHGAKKVYAIDVGTGQLAQKIREDERVVVMEKTDFRQVSFRPSTASGEISFEKGSLDFARDDKGSFITDHIDIFVCDVSFISLKNIIPKIKELLLSSPTSQLNNNKLIGDLPIEHDRDSRLRGNDGEGVDIILLVKPQFEAGAKEVTKGKGVIKDTALRQEILDDIKNFAEKEGFSIVGSVESPITGAKGNVEFLLVMMI